MKIMVSNGISEDYFRRYIETEMSSNQIYKTKEEHEYAMLLLSGDLSRTLAGIYDDVPKSMSKRFETFAEKARERHKGE